MIRSPGCRPAFSAGDPASGATTAIRQSVSFSAVQAEVAPAASTAPIVAPMPVNSPDRPSSEARYSSGVMYSEYGSPSAATMPLIAPSTSALWSTSPPA